MAIDGLEYLETEYAAGATLNRAARHVVLIAKKLIDAPPDALQRIDRELNSIGLTVRSLAFLDEGNVDAAFELLNAIASNTAAKDTRTQLRDLLDS